MNNSIHIGKINTKLQKVFAGLGNDMESVDEWLGAAQTSLKEIQEKVQSRSPAAAGAVLELFQEVEKLRHKLDRVIDAYEHEFYEEDAESAIQESLTASLSDDVYSYMAGCVLSEVVYSLMEELHPEMAEKTTSDDVSRFLCTEGLDWAYYQKMLQDEMKRIVDETDTAWQGRCCVEELCNEFPDANIPMQIALISRGYDHNLGNDSNIADYLSMRGVSPGTIPPIDENKILDVAHALFEAMSDKATSDNKGYGEECIINEEELRKLVKVAHKKGYQLRDVEGRGGDDMSPEAFLVKLKSTEEGRNPMMDIHVDGEGMISFMEKKGDKWGILCSDMANDLLVEIGLKEASKKERKEESEITSEESYPNKFHTAGDPEKVIKHQLEAIKGVAEQGLPEIYEDVVSWLHDFYPDFSWNPKGSEIEIRGLMQHPDFKKVAKKFEETTGYDIKTDLIEALKEVEEETPSKSETSSDISFEEYVELCCEADGKKKEDLTERDMFYLKDEYQSLPSKKLEDVKEGL